MLTDYGPTYKPQLLVCEECGKAWPYSCSDCAADFIERHEHPITVKDQAMTPFMTMRAQPINRMTATERLTHRNGW